MSKPQPLSNDLPGLGELPPDLAASTVRLWHDFRSVCETRGVAPPIANAWRDALPRVWACSDFVANACVARPELLVELVESGDLARPYVTGELRGKVESAVAAVENDEQLMTALRQARVREAVRVAWRDLAGWADLHELMAAMSELADACVDLALRQLYAWMCAARGTPVGNESKTAVQMSVLGLGKLGGRELNFSSDIDLIFTYSEEGQTDGQSAISNHEFFTKLGRQLIKVLDQATQDGQVFRVDMRLRPNGRSGPLALSFAATEHYYQTHGRDWERYALIKARVVAGDQQAGNTLLTELRPFVFRKYLDYGAFESIRGMKALIERELERKAIANNIKLGEGGIREVEFITQSFQLIRGGREPALQSNQLFTALDELARLGELDPQQVEVLKQAYVFLRNVEHRLQMMADRQTHILPTEPPDQARLAFAAGFEDWPRFHTRLAQVTASVHQHFNQVFASSREEAVEAPTIQDLWLGNLDDESARHGLIEIGYRDPGSALDALKAFRHGRAYHAHSKYGRERVDRLMPLLIREAAGSEDPNGTLHRLIHLVEAIGRRSAYLMLLVENPLALSQLVKLSAASAWISNWISRHPILLDELLDPITTSLSVTAEALSDEISQRLMSVAIDDLESQMEVLREACHAQMLRVAAADVSDYLDTQVVARQLCVIADVVLRHVAALAETGLRAKFGTPSAANENRPPEFGIVAYGKLGSFELGYHSDLDLVFLHRGAAPHGMTQGGARSLPNQQYYGRLGQRIVHMLTAHTPSGVLYEIDNRLRPSGRAGPLVTSLSAYRTYQRKHAWTWEHQALVRARMITGGKILRDEFETIRHRILSQSREPKTLQQEVREMRQKMVTARDQTGDDSFDLKQGRGGIVDIEFLVQYYVLRWAHVYPDLTGPRNSLDILDLVKDVGLLSAEDHRTLADAYRRYLTTEHRLKLAEKPSLVSAGELADDRRAVTDIWERSFEPVSG